MDIRYSANQKDFKRYTTDEVRKEFLITNLYKENEVVAVYSHVDRMVTLGCMPTTKTINIEDTIESSKNFGTSYFLERREIGIFNIAATGFITVDGKEYKIENKDCLYITRGAKEILFKSEDSSKPAKFYMVSSPAHCSYETKLLTIEDAAKKPIGSAETSNKRIINQFIHPDVLATCQLTMGLTELDSGSVWNTMPTHTHERRMEIYTYFNIAENNVVFHLMGQPEETRHVVMKNEDAIISPSWSIHSGCGTSNYSFIWAMGGENQTFDDMNHCSNLDIK